MRSEDFKVSNVVASVDVQFAIKLEGLAYEHGSSANYEPGKMGQKGGVVEGCWLCKCKGTGCLLFIHSCDVSWLVSFVHFLFQNCFLD